MTAELKRTDPRIERTRKLLSETLMELLTEKSYTDITVQHVTERAKVSRTTFYQHFKDVDDLLLNSLEQVYNSLAGDMDIPSIEELRAKGYTKECFDTADYNHAAKYRDFYLAMFSEKGSLVFQRWLYAYHRSLMWVFFESLMADRRSSVPLEIIVEMVTSTQLGLLKWWLERGMPYPPEQMARLAYFSLFGALNFTELGIPLPENWRELIGTLNPLPEQP
jgi:AcrR family transcriptional regulator